MTLYPYETQLVLSNDGARVLLTNAQVTIYDPSDSGFNNPLALVDHGGVAIANPLQVTAQGFLPAFQATVPQVMWLGGGYYGFISSYKGLLAEATGARTEATNAAQNALNAKTAAEAAAALAALPSDQAVDAGLVRANAVGEWKANKAYAAGQYVVNPSGQLAKALIAHTSGSTYDSTKWQASTAASGGGGGNTNYAVQDITTGAMPQRPTTDPNVLVFWISWTEPARVTSGTGGAYPNDIWFQRSAP